jgi:hypothetical protein
MRPGSGPSGSAFFLLVTLALLEVAPRGDLPAVTTGARPWLTWAPGLATAAPFETRRPRPAFRPQPKSWSLVAPVWSVGDSWHYVYVGSSGLGNFTSTVVGEQLEDGERHYVGSSNLRTLLYRQRDLAHVATLEDGRVPVRYRPPLERFAWPLSNGTVWQTDTELETPDAKHRRAYQCSARFDNVELLIGRLPSIRIACRLTRNGDRPMDRLEFEQWYSPLVRNLVRHVLHRSDGTVVEHQVIDFSLRDEEQ